MLKIRPIWSPWQCVTFISLTFLDVYEINKFLCCFVQVLAFSGVYMRIRAQYDIILIKSFNAPDWLYILNLALNYLMISSNNYF